MPDQTPTEPYNPVNPANTWDPNTAPPEQHPVVDGKPDTPDVPHPEVEPDPRANVPYDPSIPNTADPNNMPPAQHPEIIRPISEIDNTSKRVLVKKIILGTVVTVTAGVIIVGGYIGFKKVTGGGIVLPGTYASSELSKYMGSLSNKTITIVGNDKVGLPDTKVTMLYPKEKPKLWEDVKIVGPSDPKDPKETLKYISQLCGGPVCGSMQFPTDGQDWYGTINIGGDSYALSGIVGWGLKFDSPISEHFDAVTKEIKEDEEKDSSYRNNVKIESVKSGVYLLQYDSTRKSDSEKKRHSYYIIMERKSSKGDYYANIETFTVSFHKSVSASDQEKYIKDMEKAVITIAKSISYNVE